MIFWCGLRRAASPAITRPVPRYTSQHAIACLTRQGLQALIADLKRDQRVKCVRFVSDSLEGKLPCEFEAPDKATVAAFLAAHRMEPQWLMRVEQEW
jgi:hypothetical protein